MRNAILTMEAILVISATLLGGCKDKKQADIKGENIMYKKLTTNMMVENVNSTVDFYGNVLGFEFVMGVPENSQEIVTARQNNQPLGFAIMKCGNVEMMFQAKKGCNLTEQLFMENHIGNKIKLLENYLENLSTTNNRNDPIVKNALHNILKNKGNVRVSELSKNVNSSQRQLCRKFDKWVGISPR
ncbi:unnamed protein product, partial [marine sediment metagenome]